MIGKAKILIFIDWYKPGYKAGGPIRSISNLVDYLHEEFEIYIVTRNTDYLESTPYSNIKTNEWNKIDNASVFYLSKQTTKYSFIKNLIFEIQPNTIYCNSLFSLFFTLIPLFLSKKLKTTRILATRGMLSSGALAIKSYKKNFFLFTTKLLGIFNGVVFHATSDDEKENIRAHFKNVEIYTLQNLPNKTIIEYKKKHKDIGILNLVYIGRIAPEKNTLFALKTLLNCKQNINFDIYGPLYNKNYWNECKEVITLLPSNIRVSYKEALNHDNINTTLQKYHSLYLPSTGENFGHIIIEAMINSCIPIISTNTPWKNLKSKEIGYDIELTSPNQFSQTIDNLALLNNTDFNESTIKTYQFALKILDNKDLINKYINLFNL